MSEEFPLGIGLKPAPDSFEEVMSLSIEEIIRDYTDEMSQP